MKLLSFFAAMLALVPMAVVAAEGVAREDAQRPESPVFLQDKNADIPRGVFGTFYNYQNASGGGASFRAHTVTMAYWQPLDIIHTQYFMLSGSAADFKNSGSNDTDAFNLTYGRLWHNPYFLSRFYLSGHVGLDRTENNSADNDVKVAKHAAISGGATRIIPFNARNTSELNLGFNLGYVDLPAGTNSKGDGFSFSIYPGYRHTYKMSDDLSLYAGLGATLGTQEVSLSNDHALFSTDIGLTYKVGQGNLGVGYSYDFAGEHRGRNLSLSFSHPF